jgi:hypothetical protein
MPDRIIPINTKTVAGYNLFLKCKKLPRYDVVGSEIHTDEKSYNYVFHEKEIASIKHIPGKIEFDYQSYIVDKALEREKYAPFLDCGLGKTIIELMFVHDVVNQFGGKGVVWCPLSVVEDYQRECKRLYGYRMSNLRSEEWKTPIAILNYENRKELNMRNVSACVLDESSILKSGDGTIAEYLTRHACNVKFRMAASATPSPNDQTEYASHAVFLGICNTQKEFYSRFFVKDGTEWRMKQHAKDAFYDFLKSWACYIHSPSALGFQQGAELKEDPEYIIQESYPKGDYFAEGKFLADAISLKDSARVFTGLRCDKNEDRFIHACESVQNKRAIIWCSRNKEEEVFAKELNATIINGSTPIEKRVEIIDAFRSGQIQKICSKPEVLGFGVNLPEAEAHLMSGYNFSFEQLYQCVRRSHRYGRTGRLKVYVPVCEPERPVWNILQRKLLTFKNDVTELQKRFFN